MQSYFIPIQDGVTALVARGSGPCRSYSHWADGELSCVCVCSVSFPPLGSADDNEGIIDGVLIAKGNGHRLSLRQSWSVCM